MIVFDELKKSDPHLRVLVVAMLAGLFVLLAGLWWVQIVSFQDYQAHLETQSFRTVRIPAVRGKILDRNGTVLAENRAAYNVSLYLEELRKPFATAAAEKITWARAELKRQLDAEEKRLHRKLSKEERKPFILTAKQMEQLRKQARYEVASKAVAQVSERLQQPLWLNPTNFERHFRETLALPFPITTNLSDIQIARFEEQTTSPMGVDLEIRSFRSYPLGTTAAHVLGCLRKSDASAEGELAVFSFRLPDYRGDLGIEYAFDKELRGMAGAKTVLVNSAGYRQTENVWTPAEAGSNLYLTIDVPIQQAAEKALAQATRADKASAAVVMDVNNGDILAMASYPTLNPNSFIQGLSLAEAERITKLGAQKNRATQERYYPGSTFKPVVALAALERGLDPTALYYVQPDPRRPGKGCIYLKGGGKVEDTVTPGPFDFQKALIHSSNAYFITNGIWAGISRIIDLGHRLHFGEYIGLNTRQESAGTFPSLQDLDHGWHDRATANVCIGQSPVLVTPLQMAVMTAAIANGGTVLWPRLASKIEPQDPTAAGAAVLLPGGRVRDHLGVSERSLKILKDAMYADVHTGLAGTGHRARVDGMDICAKTGTAQLQDIHGNVRDWTTWFISFAPRERPKYAVVVMVESGASGGETCGPIVHDIYLGIKERESKGPPGPRQVANVN